MDLVERENSIIKEKKKLNCVVPMVFGFLFEVDFHIKGCTGFDVITCAHLCFCGLRRFNA